LREYGVSAMLVKLRCDRDGQPAAIRGNAMTDEDAASAPQKTRPRFLLKMLVRSRSLNFARQAASRGIPSDSLAKLRWRGKNVFYRPGTSDMTVLYQVLLRRGRKAEYYLPHTLKPKVILDIGSNIGAISLRSIGKGRN